MASGIRFAVVSEIIQFIPDFLPNAFWTQSEISARWRLSISSLVTVGAGGGGMKSSVDLDTAWYGFSVGGMTACHSGPTRAPAGLPAPWMENTSAEQIMYRIIFALSRLNSFTRRC